MGSQETPAKRQSTLEDHFPKKTVAVSAAVESILPLKLFMKPVVRIERSKKAEHFLRQTRQQTNNNVDEIDLSWITHHEVFNGDENAPRLKLLEIHHPLQLEKIRRPFQLDGPPVKKYDCAACGAVFESWKERKRHYSVHLKGDESFQSPVKKEERKSINVIFARRFSIRLMKRENIIMWSMHPSPTKRV